jgi:hypothetical protein
MKLAGFRVLAKRGWKGYGDASGMIPVVRDRKELRRFALVDLAAP